MTVSRGSSKGFTYMLETVIAIALLLIATAYLFSSQPLNDIDALKSTGYSAVAHLDARGDLRKLMAAGDIAGIKAGLDAFLDNFDAEICDTACSGTQRTGATVVDWYHSGYFADYSPKQLRVYLFP